MLGRFLYANLRGYRALVVLAIVLTIGQVVADLAIAFPLKWILDKAINHKDPSFPFSHALINPFAHLGSHTGLHHHAGTEYVVEAGSRVRVDHGVLSTGPGGVKVIDSRQFGAESYTTVAIVAFSSVALVVLGMFAAALSYAQLFIASFIGQNLAARLRTNLFDHLQRLSLDWHGRQRTGDLVQRLTSNIADIEKLVTDGLVDLLAGILTLVGVTVIMLLTDWQFTLLTMIVIPGLFLTVLGYTRSIKAATKRAAKSTAQVADIATEDLRAISEIKAFTLEDREARHFRRFSSALFEAKFAAGTLQSEFTPLVLVLVTASTAGIIGIGSYIATNHTVHLGPLTIAAAALSFGDLTLFITYLKQLYQPMRDLSKLTNLASSAGSAAERIQSALDEAPEIVDTARPYHGPARLGGDIRFRDVVFGYVDGQQVLKRVDLHIRAGRKVALVGLSGSGKTTLVKLIPRFYELWGGAIEIDGIDVRDIPLSVLRSNIGLVLQDSVLFEGTVRDNLAIGRPDATDAEIVAAAKQAHIHDQIIEMPGGYGSQVREQGKNFSGGQRQRLAIARAIVPDSPILILDEPTANLDVEAEAEVMHALDTLIVGRTVFMISHRLSTLGHADEIIVLTDGRIAERGSYSELKQLGGVFARLLEEQNRYSAERVGQAPRMRVVPTPPRVPSLPDAGLVDSRSMSRWVDLADLERDATGRGEPLSGHTIADLRRARRVARDEDGG
ncbi:MAG: ABC transporter ATP-binding protein [Gaiellales bacterium]